MNLTLQKIINAKKSKKTPTTPATNSTTKLMGLDDIESLSIKDKIKDKVKNVTDKAKDKAVDVLKDKAADLQDKYLGTTTLIDMELVEESSRKSTSSTTLVVVLSLIVAFGLLIAFLVQRRNIKTHFYVESNANEQLIKH